MASATAAFFYCPSPPAIFQAIEPDWSIKKIKQPGFSRDISASYEPSCGGGPLGKSRSSSRSSTAGGSEGFGIVEKSGAGSLGDMGSGCVGSGGAGSGGASRAVRCPHSPQKRSFSPKGSLHFAQFMVDSP